MDALHTIYKRQEYEYFGCEKIIDVYRNMKDNDFVAGYVFLVLIYDHLHTFLWRCWKCASRSQENSANFWSNDFRWMMIWIMKFVEMWRLQKGYDSEIWRAACWDSMYFSLLNVTFMSWFLFCWIINVKVKEKSDPDISGSALFRSWIVWV